MPRAYSADLRERVLAACERHDGSRAAIARRFSVGVSTLYDWLRQARQEGRRAARPATGGRPRLGGADGVSALLAAVTAQRDATLAELVDALATRTGWQWSASAVCRALQRLGWPRKKRRSGPASRSGPMSRRSAPRGAPRWGASLRRS